MNINKSKNLVNIIILVTGSTALSLANAAGDGPTAGALGASGATNTDVYALVCPIGTATARAQINDGITLGNELRVQIIDPHGRASTQTAPDGGAFSSQAQLTGSGAYLVTVSKNTALVEGYTIILDCFNANGLRLTGDQSTLLQNQ